MTLEKVVQDQQLRIVGTDHSSCFTNILKEWFNKETVADVTLYVGTCSDEPTTMWIPVRGNQCILAAASPVFRDIFSSVPQNEDVMPSVYMAGYSYGAVFGLMHFLYHGYSPLWVDMQEMLQILSDFKLVEDGAVNRHMRLKDKEKERRLLLEQFFTDDEGDGHSSQDRQRTSNDTRGKTERTNSKQARNTVELVEASKIHGFSTFGKKDIRKRAVLGESSDETNTLDKRSKKGDLDSSLGGRFVPIRRKSPVNDFLEKGPVVQLSFPFCPSIKPPEEQTTQANGSVVGGVGSAPTSGILIILNKNPPDGSDGRANPSTSTGDSSNGSAANLVLSPANITNSADAAPKVRYRCGTCNETFVTEWDCKQHLKTHKQPYECKICGKQYPIVSRLEYHMRCHTKEKPFVCSVCHKSFSHRKTLDNHALIHSNVRRHACAFCDKTFKRKISLNLHLRTHTKEKPYTCQHCDKRFSQSSNMRTHLKTHVEDKDSAEQQTS